MLESRDKWEGLPLYDRPLGVETAEIDDERSVIWLTGFSACMPAPSLLRSFGAQGRALPTEDWGGVLCSCRAPART